MDDSEVDGYTQQLDVESIFKILICSDTHLGHKEKKPLLKDDTFNTFTEILQL
jgi:hypothetical protein